MSSIIPSGSTTYGQMVQRFLPQSRHTQSRHNRIFQSWQNPRGICISIADAFKAAGTVGVLAIIGTIFYGLGG